MKTLTLIMMVTLTSCATYKVELGEPVWGNNEQIIYPPEKKYYLPEFK